MISAEAKNNDKLKIRWSDLTNFYKTFFQNLKYNIKGPCSIIG